MPDLNAWRRIDPKLEIDFAALAKSLMLEPGGGEEAEFRELFDGAIKAARPFALYRELELEAVAPEGASFGGKAFKSYLLGQRLAQAGKAYPYIATCGRELDALPADRQDPLVEFWLESLKEAALDCAFAALEKEVLSRAGQPCVNWLEPADASSWSLTELAGIFELFPGQDAVTLSEYMAMEPNKSRAGILHGSPGKLSNCEICPMKKRCAKNCQS